VTWSVTKNHNHIESNPKQIMQMYI